MSYKKTHSQDQSGENPFYPDETAYEGEGKSVRSPFGSAFDTPYEKSNAMDEALSKANGPKGRFKDSISLRGER